MKKLFGLFVVLFISGCAFSPDAIHLDYNSQSNAEMIQGANAVYVVVTARDKRERGNVVGHKKNGFGMELADISSDAPISDLVRSSVVEELRERGFNVGGSDDPARVDINVTEFDNDFKTGFWSVDSVARFGMMVFVKNNDGNTLYVKNIRSEGRNDGVQLMTGGNAKISLERAIASGIAKLFNDHEFIDAIMKASNENIAPALDIK